MKAKPIEKEVTSSSIKKEITRKCLTFVIGYLFLQLLIQAYKLEWVFSVELLQNTWKESLFAIIALPAIFYMQFRINIKKLNKKNN